MRQTDLNKIERIHSSLLYVNVRKKTKTSRKMAIDRVREGERERTHQRGMNTNKNMTTQSKKRKEIDANRKRTNSIDPTQPKFVTVPIVLFI